MIATTISLATGLAAWLGVGATGAATLYRHRVR